MSRLIFLKWIQIDSKTMVQLNDYYQRTRSLEALNRVGRASMNLSIDELSISAMIDDLQQCRHRTNVGGDGAKSRFTQFTPQKSE